MKLVWVTDPHLNFVSPPRIELLFQEIVATGADAVLIGGDIGEAQNLGDYLRLLGWSLPMPVYFVLGNHDYYRGSVAGVRKAVVELTKEFGNLHWLPTAGVVALTDETALVGHDGWGDGGFGNATETDIVLNDFFLIDELRQESREELLGALRRFGEEAAEHFRSVLPIALKNHRRVMVLTHVPPFAEATWHQGKRSDDDWLPWFSCRAVGEFLREAMESRPDREMEVLCGHTHGAGESAILPNLFARTGGAVYGEPRVQRVIEVA